jgi:protein ImuA
MGSPSQQALIDTLRRQVAKLEGAAQPEDDRAISTGVEALDRLLPAGGLRRGTLVEYLVPGEGCGAGTLAIAVARQACGEEKALVVVGTLRVPSSGVDARFSNDGTRSVPAAFYPPAAAAWGIELSRLILLRPANQQDALWALDQALRCPAVGAVWTACDRLDVRALRRLQLAAETGGTLGLLFRPDRLRGQPTWADVQWHIRPVRRVHEMHLRRGRKVHCASLMHPTWQLHVELLRCRGAAGGQSVVLELDETTCTWREAADHAPDSLPVAAQLADSTPRRA